MRLPGGLAGGFATVFLSIVGVSSASAATISARSETAIVLVVNQARTTRGLRPLHFDTRLQRAARAHSEDMMRGGYFGHGAFGRRLSSYGVRGRSVGENLAWGTGPLGGARAIVGEWLRSPEHRANLLRPGFRRVGVGSLVGPFAGAPRAVVVTADFAGA
jgi:uncharacterized protein YkwD